MDFSRPWTSFAVDAEYEAYGASRIVKAHNDSCRMVRSPIDSILPAHMCTPAALVMLQAIGMQESRMEHRRQLGDGPARGLWQFEMAGVRGVMTHRATERWARAVCALRDVPAEPGFVWSRLEHDDVLAACFARLLLWTDPKPLPRIGDQHAAWQLYLRTWRPGRPHPETWAALYAQACEL